jgi:hypothetical protein
MPFSVRYPFEGSYQVSQTPTVTFSHTDDPNNLTNADYWVAAYDFAMDVGTPFLAMAPGTVVAY